MKMRMVLVGFVGLPVLAALSGCMQQKGAPVLALDSQNVKVESYGTNVPAAQVVAPVEQAQPRAPIQTERVQPAEPIASEAPVHQMHQQVAAVKPSQKTSAPAAQPVKTAVVKPQPHRAKVQAAAKPISDVAKTPTVAKPKPVTKPVAVAKTTTTQRAAVMANKRQRIKDRVAWVWPMQGKVVGFYTPHKNGGIDIQGKLGQKVVAAAAGKVVYSGPGVLGYGKMVMVQNRNAYLTVYGNNAKLLVKQGQVVKQGQQIGVLGRGPHNSTTLHFEVRQDGNPMNPLDYLPG